MLNDAVLRNWPLAEVQHTLTRRDVMLYALAVGMGAQPLDRNELRFTYERELQAMPSMASVLNDGGMWIRDPRAGIDFLNVVHGEQDVTVLRPLPVEGIVREVTRITRVCDKGANKGATIEQLSELYDSRNELLANSKQVVFARGDGGYSRLNGHSDPSGPPVPSPPARAPDAEVLLPSLPQAALLYRLMGDYNPLHCDPEVAAKAGFARPILHGLCTFGMATHAVLRHACDYDATRLKRMAVRFTAPVYPGETVTFELWNGDGGVHLRARIAERNVVVLSNGWFATTSRLASS